MIPAEFVDYIVIEMCCWGGKVGQRYVYGERMVDVSDRNSGDFRQKSLHEETPRFQLPLQPLSSSFFQRMRGKALSLKVTRSRHFCFIDLFCYLVRPFSQASIYVCSAREAGEEITGEVEVDSTQDYTGLVRR